MSLKKELFIFIFLFFALFSAPLSAKNNPAYADKKQYLIDSLDLNTLSKKDRNYLDSCLQIYHQAKSDTLRLIEIGNLADNIDDVKTWVAYAFLLKEEVEKQLKQTSNSSALKNRFYEIAGSAYHFLGYYYFQTEHNDSISEKYNLMSIDCFSKTHKKKKLANALTSLAGNYTTEGRIKEAIKYYQDGLAILEEVKDTFDMARTYQNIGNILRNQNDIDGAEKYFLKSIPLFNAIKDRKQVAVAYNFLGICLKVSNKFDTALTMHDKGLAIYDSLHDDYGIATIMLNKGVVYQEKGDLDHALENYQKSLAIFEKSKDKNAISFALNSLAVIYYKKGDLTNARKAGEKDLQLAKEISYPENIMSAAQILSEIYKGLGNYREALQMHELYSEMNDSILNADTKRDAIEKDVKYQHEKELLAVEKEREKDAVAAQKEKEKRNIVILSISIGMVVLIGFLFSLYNRFRIIRKQKNIIEQQKNKVEVQKKEIEHQKDIVETKNNEITDSILYARRLQEAILPAKNSIKESLPDSFVFYRPKDIVAGDFYWVENVGENIIFAVADCTGHGVPGAMVSFVCVNALNRSVLEFGLTEPAAILDKVASLVIQAFNRSENEVKDGMDISLCVLNKRTNVLQFAGAYNPIWILRKGATEVEEFSATRQAIGNIINPVPFLNNIITLSKGDTVYLFSDGFADQFGGPKGKKLKYSAFKQILLDNNSIPMNEKPEKLNQLLEDWKGELEQVDDICVMAVRI
ncbi:MAG: tetratricopeptide repeat protein [Bacteroidia bacterium]